MCVTEVTLGLPATQGFRDASTNELLNFYFEKASTIELDQSPFNYLFTRYFDKWTCDWALFLFGLYYINKVLIDLKFILFNSILIWSYFLNYVVQC
jgi:hypothetical protein